MNPKALYWIALGIFALALNSEYQKGNLPLAHQVAGRAEAVLCRMATRAEQSLAVARILTGRPEFRVDDQFVARQQAEVERVMAERQADLERAMALRQADLDRIQGRVERMHVVLDRAQLAKMRVLERTRFTMTDATNSRTIMVCPQTGARISVDAGADQSDADVDLDIEQ
jgi:hypothetical protein